MDYVSELSGLLEDAPTEGPITAFVDLCTFTGTVAVAGNLAAMGGNVAVDAGTTSKGRRTCPGSSC